MTQAALPVSDDFTGGWTPTPVYSQINVPAPPDTDFVSIATNPSPDSFEVKLSPIYWPGSGPQWVQIRLQATTSDIVDVTVQLLQNATIIASWTVEPPSAFKTYFLTLSDGEVATITDYTSLHIRVQASVVASSGSSGSSSSGQGGIFTPCCPNALPTTLYATLANSSLCPCASGSIALVWDGFGNWTGTGPLGSCGHNITLRFSCSALTFVMQVSFPDGCHFNYSLSATGAPSCSPLLVTFPPAAGGGCGCTSMAGTFLITVTA